MINTPASIAKICFAGDASFGPPVTAAGVTGDVALGTDAAEPADPATQLPAGTTTDGCSALDQRGRRGRQDRPARPRPLRVLEKAKNAQNAGAIGVVIANTLGRGVLRHGR